MRVRSVQSHGSDVTRAQPGSRTALALTGIEVADLERGAWICGDPKWPMTARMRAEVAMLAEGAHPLRPREWVRLHLGTADIGARVVASGGELQPGECRPVRVILQEPVLARAGDRFVLRRSSPTATIGGGVVVDPLPPRRRFPVWERLADPQAALGRVLMEAASDGVDPDVLPARLGLPPAVVQALTEPADRAVAI